MIVSVITNVLNYMQCWRIRWQRNTLTFRLKEQRF